MATLPVKGLDDQLYAALGARAALDHRSVSQEVVMMIRAFPACPAHDPRRATEAVLEMAGSWQDERTTEEIVADLRKARQRQPAGSGRTGPADL